MSKKERSTEDWPRGNFISITILWYDPCRNPHKILPDLSVLFVLRHITSICKQRHCFDTLLAMTACFLSAKGRSFFFCFEPCSTSCARLIFTCFEVCEDLNVVALVWGQFGIVGVGGKIEPLSPLPVRKWGGQKQWKIHAFLHSIPSPPPKKKKIN